jgi:signal transduction histidine kinase
MNSSMGSHWGYRVLFYVRIIWIVIHLLVLGFGYGDQVENIYLFILSAAIAGLIPQLVWLKADRLQQWVYPTVEFLVSGLFLLYSSYQIGQYFSYIAIPAMCAAVHIHTTRLRVPLWIWFSVIPSIAMVLVSPLSSFNLSIIEGFLFFGLGYVVWKVIDTQRKMQQLLDENERQRQVLEQYAMQVETITLLEERNRMARELHDTVGHTLTSVIMGLDATSYLLRTEPVEAQESIRLLRAAASKGLDEVREQIHHIAPMGEDESLSVQLRRIAEEFALHTGTTVDYAEVVADITVPMSIKAVLVRCLQESITNAKRHGGANHIRISFELQPEHASLVIHDDGSGMENIQYGYGLKAMQERIEAYHGELQMISDPNSGTMVKCHMPLKQRKAR